MSLAWRLVEMLRDNAQSTQVILTTHNTDLLSNQLLRPDAYFLMPPVGTDGRAEMIRIRSLHELSSKEIRKGMNLQKMFKEGQFQ